LKAVIGFCVVVVLFLTVSFLSFLSIEQLRGNARVVNYTGIVRGATQKLIKEELMGHPDDALIKRLESIVDDLITGGGPNNLVVLDDADYLSHLLDIRRDWTELKGLIRGVRQGEDAIGLYDASQAYFDLANETVSLAEVFSEKQVRRSITILIVVNSIFVGFIAIGLIYFISALALKKRADSLGKIAYVDSLTQLDNRASCEMKIAHIKATMPETVAVIMFDMNNLKLANDFLGHKYGDQIILSFARVLKSEVPANGFIGRYGGDEFLGIFASDSGTPVSEAEVDAYLNRVKAHVDTYNKLYTSEIQKISFAAGYTIDNPRTTPIEYLINDADKKMYVNKRIMKGG
jgi:diguanylate cyclase (GGDEF)-like protein